MKPHRPIEGEYTKVAAGKWVKWNPILRIRSTIQAVEWDSKGRATKFTVYREQPKEDIQAIVDLNVAMQNADKGNHVHDLITQTSRMPITVHQQIMQQCGWQPKHGYDEKKFRQILNDRDNYKLKTVAGNI